jgi:VanZ family protein
MNPRKPTNNLSTTDLEQLVFKLAPLIVICSILIVLIATLFPFNIAFQNGFSITEIIDKFQQTSTHLSDRIKNLLLFLPLGFGLMCLVHKKSLGTMAKFVIVLLVSFSLSLLVEVLQAFLPSREPTIADIFNNTFSGLLGFVCFYLWKLKIIDRAATIIEKNKKSLSYKKLIAIFIGYIALTFISPFFLQNATNLSNWDLNTPLLLGNERTGDRPWQGYVSELYIADRAISKKEIAKVFVDKNSLNNIGNSLLAHYQLTGQGNYPDRTGHLPDLAWRGQPSNNQNGKGVYLTATHWLETKFPISFLNQRLRETDQFTIGATVATANKFQRAPARIISLSNSTTERNLTVEQQDTKLSVRLRTPINGKNAQYLKKLIPDIFADTNPHHIVITYAGSVVRVYIDKLQNFHSFNLLEILPKSDKLMYYGLIFIPLGSLLALITTLAQGRFIFYLFFYIGILLPALILELILASSSSREIQLDNLLLGILITAFTVVVFKLRLPTRLKSRLVN